MNRLIVLTGAPETTKLDWDESNLNKNDLLTRAVPNGGESANLSSDSNTSLLQWRQLSKPAEDVRALEMAAGTKLGEDSDARGALFLTPEDLAFRAQSGDSVATTESSGSISSTESASKLASHFYEHSFSIQKNIPESLISELEPDQVFAGRSSFDSDITSPTTPSSAIRAPWQWPELPAPQSQHLSDLEDVPNATYLHSIEPQTMTVNLIVAILSIAPPRSVTTGAKWGKERQSELVELLVGDDTKTGFSITMWLPPEMHVSWKDAIAAPDGYRSTLRRNLRLLRPRDIILIRNVALSSFRGKVHGQSLRRDVTKVDLLFRRKQDSEDIGGSYSAQAVNKATDSDPQLMKVKKVRDWMISFVVDPDEEVSRSRSRKRGKRMLPPDTQ